MSATIRPRSLRLLEDWIAQAKRHLYTLPGTGTTCYGLGHRGHWALQAHDTAFSAFAVLADDPDTDFRRAGMSRDEMTATALAMCRFTFRSHHAGGGASTDAKTWGNSWISALGLERMMHGVRAIRAHLSEDDRAAIRRVLLSESDWLLDHYPVTAGLTQNNHPESNMWNGTILHRTARMFPDAPRAAEYREKGTSFLANAVSLPSDAASDMLLDGKPLRDWHVGPNFTETFGCNHHGYMNVGYMVITLSNLAMMHFACREEGWDAPEALYLHADGLWQAIRTCTFDDGRLWRIGGDSRVRWCYCQDYAIPAWLFVQERFGDRGAGVFEERWLAQVETECAANGDGSFLGRRLKRLEEMSPLYYTRLEGDKACTLGMGVWWRRAFGDMADLPARHACASTLPAWSDDLHGASLVRDPRRLASFCWVASEGPQGMCLPPEASDMAEWRYSLGGRVRGQGIVNGQYPIRPHTSTRFDGGFATCGRVGVVTDVFVSEGDVEDTVARIDVAFAALPDGQTVVGLQRALMSHRAPIAEVKGLHLPIPNDVHNGFVRRYDAACGTRHLKGYPTGGETVATGGTWLCVDNRLGVLGIQGGAELFLHHPERPQVVIKPYKHLSHAVDCGGLLYADEICYGACSESFSVREAGTLFDIAFAVRSCVTAEETEAWSREGAAGVMPLADADAIRAVRVPGADGASYLVAAHFGDTATESAFALACGTPVAVDGYAPIRYAKGTLTVCLEPGTARVIRL